LDAPPEELCKVKGMGKHGAVLLKTVKELSGRYLTARTRVDDIARNSRDYYQLLRPYFFGARNELLCLLCMDGKHKVLGIRRLGEGNVNAVAITTRLITEAALALNAAAVVLAHNHVSGIAFPSEDDIAVSPADGRVIRVEPKADPITGEVRPCISIFMNVFNVHVNRSPVAGRVEAIRYFPGKFFNAALDKASTDNERCAYLVRDDGGRSWVMVQVAGLIARRIVCRVEEGDTLARGERYGMIRFGSRVDLYLPPDYSAVVANGDVVAAGESILARKFQA